MPVKKDDQGRRSVEAHTEVPGTPEEVWRAIATGEGISSWFVPTTVEGRVGGKTVSSFGPGMDAESTITAWHPPHRYVAETGGAASGEAEASGAGEAGGDGGGEEARDPQGGAEAGPGRVATEWIVEARGGDRCVVRVVHRWFADDDSWDGEFEGHAYGWATSYFRMLQLYLAHFSGEPCSPALVMAMSEASAPESWKRVRSGFQVDDRSGRVRTLPPAPPLSGQVERLVIDDPDLLRIRTTAPQVAAALEGMEGEDPELLLRIEDPSPGLAHLFVMAMGEQSLVSARIHLYGAAGAERIEEMREAWEGWLQGTMNP